MNSADSQQPYERPELVLESRVFALTIFLVIFGVLVLKLGIETQLIERRLARLEADIASIRLAHEAP